MDKFKILSLDETIQAIHAIDQLSDDWIKRAPEPLASFTLGAATYLDATIKKFDYEKIKNQYNPKLSLNFMWLYTRLIDRLAPVYGPMVLEPDLALPGFHIFGAQPGQTISEAGCRLMEKPIASVHVDAPYRAHMQTWSKFKEIDYLNPLSITLCLCLPLSGGGLNTWQDIDTKIIYAGHEMLECNFKKISIEDYKFTPYELGHAYIFNGHQIHQIAPAQSMQPTDRRITLQAHALRCDGAWRLFF
jgi:hypothetical protein